MASKFEACADNNLNMGFESFITPPIFYLTKNFQFIYLLFPYISKKLGSIINHLCPEIKKEGRPYGLPS